MLEQKIRLWKRFSLVLRASHTTRCATLKQEMKDILKELKYIVVVANCVLSFYKFLLYIYIYIYIYVYFVLLIMI